MSSTDRPARRTRGILLVAAAIALSVAVTAGVCFDVIGRQPTSTTTPGFRGPVIESGLPAKGTVTTLPWQTSGCWLFGISQAGTLIGGANASAPGAVVDFWIFNDSNFIQFLKEQLTDYSGPGAPFNYWWSPSAEPINGTATTAVDLPAGDWNLVAQPLLFPSPGPYDESPTTIVWWGGLQVVTNGSIAYR